MKPFTAHWNLTDTWLPSRHPVTLVHPVTKLSTRLQAQKLEILTIPGNISNPQKSLTRGFGRLALGSILPATNRVISSSLGLVAQEWGRFENFMAGLNSRLKLFSREGNAGLHTHALSSTSILHFTGLHQIPG